MIAVISDVHYRMSVALIRDLAQAGVQVVACDTDQHPNAVGFASRHVWRRATLPTADAADGLWALCRQLSAEFGEKPVLLPVGAKTLQALAAQADRFSQVCRFAVATPEQLALLNDKNAVHALACSLSIPVPAQPERLAGEADAAFFARCPMPCVVKPACGEQHGLTAAARYKIARSQEELEAAYRHFQSVTGEEPLVQEYLPGGALGCSVLADQGRVLAAVCHRRLREYPITGGPSSCCEAITAPELEAHVRRLAEQTGFTGPAMFEFKEGADGTPRLLEVNPRVWGTYPLTRVAGTNFTYLWFCLAAGLDLPAWQPPQPVMMAFYPSDLAAALGYAKAGRPRMALTALLDALDPKVNNGLREKDDPGPWRSYWNSLLGRRKQK